MSTTTRGFTVATSVELVTEECCTCGVTFAMPAAFQQQCVNNPGINVGTLQRHRGPAETQLAYCHGMQERKRPGSEGRYFIAAVYEDTPLEEVTDE